MSATLVLCLGNDVLSDDAFGYHLAERLSSCPELTKKVEITFASLAGFNLLPILENRERLLVVDTIVTGEADPGTIHFFPMGEGTPSRILTSSHQITLPDALALGRALGMTMPRRVDVMAVEAEDVYTLSEQMTASVEQALEPALNRVREWIATRGEEEDRERTEATPHSIT